MHHSAFNKNVREWPTSCLGFPNNIKYATDQSETMKYAAGQTQRHQSGHTRQTAGD